MGKNRLTQATKHHHSWVTTGDRMLKVVSAFATDQSCVGYRGTKLWDLKSNKPNLSEKYGLWVPPFLVGGIPTPLKNMKVSWDYSSQYIKELSRYPSSLYRLYGGNLKPRYRPGIYLTSMGAV